MKLKAKGKFRVTKDSIRIVTDTDFCRYYRWLFNKAHYNTIKNQVPMHGAHINIASPKIHKVDCSKYLYLNNKDVYFEYSVEGNYGGFKKGFLNFWLDIWSKECEDIAYDLGIVKKEKGFELFHISILNTKNT